MNTNNNARTLKVLLTTEQFKRLIDNVMNEQLTCNEKKLIKSNTYANK